MGFYDSITSKMSYDQVIRLKDKINFFIDNYNYLLSNESSAEVSKIINKLGDLCALMRMFISNNVALELVTSIKKIIRMLIEQDKNKILEFTRTVGLMCLQVMFDGSAPIIPKIRSKCSFLGNVGGGVITSANVIKNILAIAKKFEKEIEVGDDEDFMDKYDKVNDLMEQVIENTVIQYNKGFFKDERDQIIQYIKGEPELMKLIFEDVLGMYESKDYTEEEIRGLTVLDDINVLNFLQLIQDVLNKIKAVAVTTNASKMPKILKLRKIKKRKEGVTGAEFKNNKGTISTTGKPPLEQITKDLPEIGGSFQKAKGSELLASGVITALKKGYDEKTAADAMDGLPAPLAM